MSGGSTNPLDPLGRGGHAHQPPPVYRPVPPLPNAVPLQLQDHSHLFFLIHVVILGMFVTMLAKLALTGLLRRAKNLVLSTWIKLTRPSIVASSSSSSSTGTRQGQKWE